MLIIRGVNVFPSQIEAALLTVEGTLPHYQLVLSREKDLDQLDIQVEVTGEIFSDKISALESFRQRIAHAVQSTTGIHATVSLVEPHTIPRSEGKARRVIDKRTL